MEDIVFSYLTPSVVNRYSNIVIQCKGRLKFYHGTTKENADNILKEGFRFKSRVANPNTRCNLEDDVIYTFKEDKLYILKDKYETVLEIEYDGTYYQTIEQRGYDDILLGECLLSNIFIKRVSII